MADFFVLSINKLLIMTAVTAVTAAVIISLAMYFAGYYVFLPALFGAVCVGGAGLYLLAKDIERIVFSEKRIFFHVKFFFRLACFAILLYLLLVRFKLNPLGVVTGLALPTLCMAMVLFFVAHRK